MRVSYFAADEPYLFDAIRDLFANRGEFHGVDYGELVLDDEPDPFYFLFENDVVRVGGGGMISHLERAALARYNAIVPWERAQKAEALAANDFAMSDRPFWDVI